LRCGSAAGKPGSAGLNNNIRDGTFFHQSLHLQPLVQVGGDVSGKAAVTFARAIAAAPPPLRLALGGTAGWLVLLAGGDKIDLLHHGLNPYLYRCVFTHINKLLRHESVKPLSIYLS